MKHRVTLILCITMFCVSHSSAADKPNILFILTDDQGWWDVGMRGNEDIDTPVIDRLSREGVDFTRFYAAPVCAPTRAGLMTGRYCFRTGLYNTRFGGDTLGINEVTIAEMLKKAGYRTGCFGKWHLGKYAPYQPHNRGFDEFLGHYHGHIDEYDYPDQIVHNGKPVEARRYVTDLFTDAAIEFIEATGETKHGRIGWIPGRMDIRRMKSSRQQYVVQPDGSGARLIGEGGHEYFTPDGQHMLICDPKGGDPSKWLGECSAGLYNIKTGLRCDVTKELTWLGSHPAISPDGQYVAADNAGHSYPGAIVIVSLNGSAPLRVLCYHHASWESGHITHPTVHWSPDGTKLLFISDKDSPDKKKGDIYLAVVKQPEAPRQPHVANNRADGPLLTWRPARRHTETKEYVVMRSVPSPRPNLQGVKLDRTGVFEEVGVVPVVDTILIGKHLDANSRTRAFRPDKPLLANQQSGSHRQ